MVKTNLGKIFFYYFFFHKHINEQNQIKSGNEQGNKMDYLPSEEE